MKKIFCLAFCTSMLLSSCGKKVIDDTKAVCSNDCTTFSGKFTTTNGVALQKIGLSFVHKISYAFAAPSIRRISNAITVENGNFHMNFYLKNEELGDTAKGWFILSPDLSKLNSNEYLYTNSEEVNSLTIYRLKTRDTALLRDFYVPRKTKLKVNLKGFNSNVQGDMFAVDVLYQYGWSDVNNVINDFTGTKFDARGNEQAYERFKATSANFVANLNASRGDSNIVRIIKFKNGVGYNEDFRVFIPDQPEFELTYNY